MENDEEGDKGEKELNDEAGEKKKGGRAVRMERNEGKM